MPYFWSVLVFVLLTLFNFKGEVAWTLQDKQLVQHTRPSIHQDHDTISVPLTANLDANDALECLELQEGELSITDCNGYVHWQSPSGWDVREAQTADLNRDGQDEAVLLVWRTFQPWPVDAFMPYGGRINSFHDANNLSCHVILIGWINGGFGELWAGSAMVQPLAQLRAVDLDGDGWQELAALEFEYDSRKKTGPLTVWEWQGFVFSLIDRSEGAYRLLEVFGDKTHQWVNTR